MRHSKYPNDAPMAFAGTTCARESINCATTYNAH